MLSQDKYVLAVLSIVTSLRPESKLHVKMLRAILALEDAGYIYMLDLHVSQ